MSKKASNSPVGQGELENGHGGIIPVPTLKRSLNRTQADYTITTSATSITIPDTVKLVRIMHTDGELVNIGVKDSLNTSEATATIADYKINSTAAILDFMLPVVNKDATDYPTALSLIATSATATVSVRFY